MSAYISELNRDVIESAVPAHRSTLSQRLTEWHGGLPPVSRHRPFSMSEIEAALETQGRYIGEELLRMGWQRKRIWARSGSYYRYWTPPPQ